MLRNDAFIAGNNGEERTVDPNGEWRKNDL